MKKIILVVYLAVILLVLIICFGCGDTKKLEDRALNLYYPSMAITESGKKLSLPYCAQGSPNDPVVTVVLVKAGKEYYYDLRK